MLQITCPHCGPRNEAEFAFGGEGHITRPPQPEQVNDREWAHYLYVRENPKGIHYERWQHRFGCRQWFNLARDTLSHKIHTTYAITAAKPKLVEVQP